MFNSFLGQTAVFYASYRDVHTECLEHLMYLGLDSDQLVNPGKLI